MAALFFKEMDELVKAATEVAQRAYAPYSSFRVGSALRLSNREMVTGVNVENMSFGLTLCAERSAVVRAVAQFGPEIRIEAVAVVNLNDSASPPCGACRQVLAEFAKPDALISFPARAKDGGIEQVIVEFRELLPFGFVLDLKRES